MLNCCRWKILLLFISLSSSCLANSFIDGARYKGWLWFEEKAIKEEQKVEQAFNNKNLKTKQLNAQQAKVVIEQFAKELEDLKYIMLATPNPENIKAYRDKEQQMWRWAAILHDNWNMANLLYPEQRDLINNPVNAHGVKAKRALVEQENNQKIKEFAQAFDLVLFFDDNCYYCKLLTPMLARFAVQYNFNIEAVSGNGAKHEYFKTVQAEKLIDMLGITAFPTVIAVSRDARHAFELIRGYVSQSELEEYVLLAVQYIEQQKLQKGGKHD